MVEAIITILLAVVSVGLTCATFYFDVKKRLLESANGAISNAEDLDKEGKEKMAYVVKQLKSLVPSAVRFIFTDKMIESVVQSAFDDMKDYAKKQVEKNKDK